MNIGIVAPYNTEKPAGFERTTLGILEGVLQQSTEHSVTIYAKKGSGLKPLLAAYPHATFVELGFGLLWKDLGLRFAPKADVYVLIGQQVPLFFRPKPFVVFVYDLAYKHIPAPTVKGKIMARLMDALMRGSCKSAAAIIGLSQATCDDVRAMFGVAPDKLRVVYPGFHDMASVQEEPIKVPEKYFLSMGTIKKRKNNFAAISAFAQFKKSHPEYSLVLAGKYDPEKPYLKKIFSFIKQEGLEDSVALLGRVSDAQVAYLYKHAFAVVFPSLLEGFGYPILEAASCGVPVITSNKSSLKEVAGDSALLVDPTSADAIASAMARFADDQGLRQAIIQKGKQRIKDFSWDKTGMRFLEVVEKIK